LKKDKRQSFVVVKMLPTLLNRLYLPVCRNNKPSIRKNPDAKKFVDLIRMEAIRQKCKIIPEGDIKMIVDFCIKKGNKEPDFDAPIKLLADALQGVMYKDDKQVKFFQIAKHINQEESEIVVMVEEISDNLKKV